MRRLIVFNTESLDGYFSGKNGDLSWIHAGDKEWNAFVEGNAKGGGTLVFGRITYELMASYWPTPAAAKVDPILAKAMNARPKFVFSRTLDKASWSNTTVLKGDPAEEIRRLKGLPGEDLVILGSGSLVSRLTREGLIDEYQIVVYPVVLGEGRSMFDGAKEELRLTLVDARVFKNGNVVLRYKPAA